MADTKYEIHFNEASASASNLETQLAELKKQLDELTTVKTDLLSDANWYGPNKSEFSNNFEKYLQQLQDLYNNGLVYLEKLNTIIQEYSKAEQA